MMKRARIKVDLQLLAEALCLPHGVTIERAISDPCVHSPRVLELVITGEDLPVAQTRAGDIIPEIEAICIRDDDYLTGMPSMKVRFRPQEGWVSFEIPTRK